MDTKGGGRVGLCLQENSVCIKSTGTSLALVQRNAF